MRNTKPRNVKDRVRQCTEGVCVSSILSCGRDAEWHFLGDYGNRGVGCDRSGTTSNQRYATGCCKHCTTLRP